MTAALISIAATVAGIFGLAWLARKSGADSSALAAAEGETRRIEAEQAAFANTIEVIEDATLAIHDRATALDSLRARHPKP